MDRVSGHVPDGDQQFTAVPLDELVEISTDLGVAGRGHISHGDLQAGQLGRLVG